MVHKAQFGEYYSVFINNTEIKHQYTPSSTLPSHQYHIEPIMPRQGEGHVADNAEETGHNIVHGEGKIKVGSNIMKLPQWCIRTLCRPTLLMPCYSRITLTEQTRQHQCQKSRREQPLKDWVPAEEAAQVYHKDQRPAREVRSKADGSTHVSAHSRSGSHMDESAV